MAGRIREEDIAAVRERARIEEIVGGYVQLRRSGGGSLVGLCPFHDEKSPSFSVTPARGLFYCFGCQAGGDVIAFTQRVENLSFVEAVELLASRVGVALQYEQGAAAPSRQQGQRVRILEANAAAARFYADQLGGGVESEPGRVFLKERGFDQATAEVFGVGFAPRSGSALLRHLRTAGFADEDLTAAGLVTPGQSGLRDRFRGRLVWPIRTTPAEVVGFGARRLFEDDTGPKYLNTPETSAYHKSEVLFGLDVARKEVARRQQAVVVEGYTDVMACHVAGVPTAVATCGTSFGEAHVRVLRRLLLDQDEFRGEVIFCFDGDAAGQKAALRAFTEEQRFVTQLFVAVEPDGLDPCELWMARGPEAVRDLVARRVPLFTFVIRARLDTHDLSRAEGRVAALRETAPVVAGIKDRSLRPEYTRALAGWLGMEVDTVRAAVAQGERGSATAAPRPPVSPPPSADAQRPNPADPDLLADRELVKAELQSPAVVDPAADSLDPAALGHPGYAAVHAAVRAAGGVTAAGPGGAEWVARVLEAAGNDAARSLVTELAVEPPRLERDVDARYAAVQLARVEERVVTAATVEAKSTLQRMNPEERPGDYQRVFGELLELEARRRQLREVIIGEL